MVNGIEPWNQRTSQFTMPTMGRAGPRVGILTVIIWSIAACSSDENSADKSKCTPGQSSPCGCSDGRTGAQTCRADGTFETCVCDGSGGTAGIGTGGQAGSGGTSGQATGGSGGTSTDSLTGLWSKVFPGYFEIVALDVDASGTLVVVGTSAGPVDFGNGPVGKSLSSLQSQLLIAGFDSNGVRKFAFAKDANRTFSATLSMKTTSQNRIILSGVANSVKVSTSYQISWPCGTQAAVLGDALQFVDEIDESGNCVWDNTYPSPWYSGDPTPVVVTPDDSAYVTAIPQLIYPGTRRFLADGSPDWVKQFGGSAAGAFSNGSAVIATYGGMSLPTGSVSGLFTMAKLDPSGGVQAGAAWGTPFYDSSQVKVGLDVGGGDHVAVALHYVGTVDVGGGELTSSNNGASPSKLFALFDQGFAHAFSRSIDEPTSDSGQEDKSESVAVVTGSKTVFLGSFWRTVDFGSGPVQAQGTTDTDFDIFVASYGLDGAPLLSRRFGGDGSDGVRAATSDATGAVYVSGYFSTSVNFGDASHENPPTDAGTPTTSTYLVKLRP